MKIATNFKPLQSKVIFYIWEVTPMKNLGMENNKNPEQLTDLRKEIDSGMFTNISIYFIRKFDFEKNKVYATNNIEKEENNSVFIIQSVIASEILYGK